MEPPTPYSQLATEATHTLRVVQQQARRGFVLEVTGTPKAGKTTSIAMIESFFKTCGWRVHVLTERAAICPLKMKGHFFFNTWTTCTMLAEFLNLLDREIDLIILDRGFFDALIWLELQHRRGQVDAEELKVFRDFVLLRRWQVTDAVALLEVQSTTALQREHKDRLIPRRGSVMRDSALIEFNESIASARDMWTGQERPRILDVICDGDDQKQIVAGIIRAVLPEIEAWADPTIAAIPRDFARKLFTRPLLKWDTETWKQIADSSVFRKRSAFEKDNDFVQLVACGAAIMRMQGTEDPGVFVFDRTGSRKIPYGRRTIFHRCHIAGQTPLEQNLAAEAIQVRLRDQLHIRDIPNPEPIGMIWDAKSPIESKHMGILFTIRLGDSIAETLMEKEFKTSGRGHPMTSTFSRPGDLLDKDDLELEPWSRAVIAERWL